MRQVRIQGCLPTLAVLLVVAALGAVAFTAGLAVVLVTAGLLLLLAAIRAVRRLLGVGPPASPGGTAGGVEAVPPGWLDHEEGPIVEAGPRDPTPPGGDAEVDPTRDGERDLPPRG